MVKRTSETDVKIGAMIRETRRNLVITREELSDYLGVTHQQVSKYERGDDSLRPIRLWDVSQMLGIAMEDFFSDEIVKPISKNRKKVMQASRTMLELSDDGLHAVCQMIKNLYQMQLNNKD